MADQHNLWDTQGPSLAFDDDDTFGAWTMDPTNMAINDQAVADQFDPNIFNWSSQPLIDPGYDFGNAIIDPNLLSEGSITPNLATRSNTPSSDTSRHMSSPGQDFSGVQPTGTSYQSRLPRRRSLYSRPRPLTRPTNSPRASNTQPWAPVFTTTAETPGASPNTHTTTNTGPLRRSDSSTSLGSECSNSSAYSTASASSATSGRRSSSSNRRQRKKATASSSTKKTNPDARPFKCTFCCDAFKSKYDWRRHEKSLHLDLEVYKCAPISGTFPDADTPGTQCAYCHTPNPDPPHLETHNHTACTIRPISARCFRRRDHLAQHLRVFHKVANPPPLDQWVDQVPPVTSRCGFCNAQLSSWEERADHLSVHFRQGQTMRDWQGGHGFDESIAARLTNSLPPYYLATEAQSLVPFSATSAASKDHHAQISARTAGAALPLTEEVPAAEPNSNNALPTAESSMHTPALLDSRARSAEAFADILASHLARFALEYKQMGVVLTDEALQREARQVLYSSDDPWNQTIADSPMWMREFRERNGLN